MKTVLQFSGGRDSLAVLFRLEAFWEGMTVAWCDGGDSAPELYALMARVQGLVPHFVRVEGQAPSTRAPATADTWLDCCNIGIWKPMLEWVRANEVRYLVRGTRKIDPIPWPPPGAVFEQATFILPIWDWTDRRLAIWLERIAKRGFVPVYPHDCLHCPVARPCDRPELRNVA